MIQADDVFVTWSASAALGSDAWRLTWSCDALTLTTPSAVHSFVGAEASRLSVTRWLLGYSLVVRGLEPGRFRGVRRQDVDAIRAAIGQVVARAGLVPILTRLVAAGPQLSAVIDRHRTEGRWIAYDSVAPLLPTEQDVLRVQHAGRSGLLTAAELGWLRQWGENPWEAVRAVNAATMRAELALRRGDFFDRVESTPLTEEQARAVVTFDNRVRVIAAAGSGKTSVMVARAAYAVARGLVAPERILLLAFNADAAAELQTRVTSRLAALGLPGDGVRASTFHSFGRSLIGRATGRKPSIAAWVESGADTAMVNAIIDELRNESPDFRFKWDVFQLLYARLSSAPDGGVPDSVDRNSRKPGFRTFRGETVRSEGERLIADWLFLNRVEYRYEQPYAYPVADSDHAQYRPDFYYPQIDVWHEHWALRADGTPPESFTGYADAMDWKRATHRRYHTTLIETTWHEIIDLRGFTTLAAQLTQHGVRLDWDPDRATAGAVPVEPERLARLMRTFLAHVKANGLTRVDLEARLGGASPRTRLFVELFWWVHDRWEQHLWDANAIDFDDMLLQAAGLLERDPSLAEFDLVLVDEFQDTSKSRARLVRALTRRTGSVLLTVGDDWQAINRFAGADLSTMTNFEETFGPGQTLYLQTTFRNPQRVADVAGRFISRNPAQLRKTVTAHRRDPGQPVLVVRLPDRNAVPGAIRDHLRMLATQHPGSTVDILGRYRQDRRFVPRDSVGDLRVAFRTIHAAKGLEADHVVVPNLTTGAYGFPSEIDDDPVLQLAITEPEEYPDAEERRLFYVALTRARQSVALFTVAGQESPFLVELLTDPDVLVRNTSPTAVAMEACPDCHQGTLTVRNGRYGTFLGCTRYPACTYTRNLQHTPHGSNPGR